VKRLLLLSFIFPLFIYGQDGPFYFTHNNIQREYYLHIPNNLPVNSPIVYALHGWGGGGDEMMTYTGFNFLSDQYNFAICYPTALIDGDGGSSGLTSWNTNGLSDVDFIHALNDTLQNLYLFDTNRTFATGFSYGAEMCFHLSRCQNSNVIDAIAPLAGSIFNYMNICMPSTNISTLVLHGTNDNVVNYNGGYFPNYGPYMSANDIVSDLVIYNSCILDTTYSLLDLNNDNNLTDVVKYHNYNTGNRVWFYTVNNGSHVWFDTAPWGSDDFWASEEIWHFFSQINSITTNLDNTNHKINDRYLIKIIDVLGREKVQSINTPLFFIYNDGTVEKRIFIE
tara:strand:- start:888 stop:1901 length:1014 start_codon:yes stop_codon:yes gene_type:complete